MVAGAAGGGGGGLLLVVGAYFYFRRRRPDDQGQGAPEPSDQAWSPRKSGTSSRFTYNDASTPNTAAGATSSWPGQGPSASGLGQASYSSATASAALPQDPSDPLWLPWDSSIVPLLAPSNRFAHGSFGDVYRGDLVTGGVTGRVTRVAVKVVTICSGKDGSSMTQPDFDRELEVMLALRHARVVALLGHSSDGGSKRALVTEYLPGGSLEDALKGRPALGWRDRARAALHLAEALQFLHTAVPSQRDQGGTFVPIIHRDVKPANVLFDDKKNAKLSDYGLALMVPELADQSTVVSVVKSNLFAGTPGFVVRRGLGTPLWFFSLHESPFEIESPFSCFPFSSHFPL